MSDRLLAELAESQHGLITIEQARGSGLGDDAISWRIAAGRWVRCHEGVYRIAGSVETFEQALVAACLAIGPEAAVSHRAAAILHGLLTYTNPPVEVTTNRARSPELGDVFVHRLADFHEDVVTVVRGIRCTTPARTLVDLGAVCRSGTVEAALDRGVGRRLVGLGDVRTTLRSVARRGRRGAGVMRTLLDERQDEVAAGVLEARMATLLRRFALPMPMPEYTVRDEHGGFVAIVDFAYPELKIAIELDGYEPHVQFRVFADDRTRQNALVLLGWQPLRYLWADVDALSPRVADDIRSEIRRRRLNAT